MRLINEKSRNVLPGTRFNINEQCMQKYGKKSSHYRKGVSFNLKYFAVVLIY